MQKALVFISALLFTTLATSAENISESSFRWCAEEVENIEQIERRLDQEANNLDNHWYKLKTKNAELDAVIFQHRLAVIDYDNCTIMNNPQSCYYLANKVNTLARKAHQINQSVNSLSQEYNVAEDRYNKKVNESHSRIDRYNNQCVGISVSKRTYDKVCGNNNYTFCQRFK